MEQRNQGRVETPLSCFTPEAQAGASKAGGLLGGAAGRELWHSPYLKPLHEWGTAKEAIIDSRPGVTCPEARGQGPAVPSQLGTPLWVWCHRVDTGHFHKPLVAVPALYSPSWPEEPGLAVPLSQAVLNTKGFYAPPTSPCPPKPRPLPAFGPQPWVLCSPCPPHHPHC